MVQTPDPSGEVLQVPEADNIEKKENKIEDDKKNKLNLSQDEIDKLPKKE